MSCLTAKSSRKQLIISVRELSDIKDHLILGPVPGCVEMCWSLQVSKLDFVRSRRADDADREFHLQELVTFMPVNLEPNAETNVTNITPETYAENQSVIHL